MRSVTCTTAGCVNEGVSVEIPDAPPEGDLVQCGPCGRILETTVDLDKQQRDELRALTGYDLP